MIDSSLNKLYWSLLLFAFFSILALLHYCAWLFYTPRPAPSPEVAVQRGGLHLHRPVGPLRIILQHLHVVHAHLAAQRLGLLVLQPEQALALQQTQPVERGGGEGGGPMTSCRV